MDAPLPNPSRFLGVAGPQTTDQEKATVKQALFMLRYRIRVFDAASGATA